MASKHRPPSHPGEILLKDFLEPFGLTQKQFAEHLGWTYARLNEIVNMHRGVTADSALAFSEAFCMEPERDGVKSDTALFFGLSGTGKTTLSADFKRFKVLSEIMAAGPELVRG